jgi:hypothetical protein
MDLAPDLSIVLDLETMEITGEILLEKQIAHWLQAARRIAPRTFELIICSRHEKEIALAPTPGIKTVRGAGKGYYALKNEGARAAAGTYVLFSDIDCRPEENYCVRVLEHFAAGGDILGGRTFYDGADLASRVCTVTSFGRLHGIDQLRPYEGYLAHNIAVRRTAFPQFFEPFTARYGGDKYLTNQARQRGLPLPVYQDLILYHESAAHSLRGLLDRHLRDIVGTTFMAHGAAMTPWQIVRQAHRTGRQRWLSFKRRALELGFTPAEKERARWLLLGYQWLDVVATLGFVVRPSLLARWNAYQFGEIENCAAVFNGEVPPSACPAVSVTTATPA